MEFKGKLIHAYPAESGTSANGNQWQRRTIVLENTVTTRTGATFSEYLACELWNERVEQFKSKLAKDAILVAFADVTSRESSTNPGRWFTSVKCYNLETVEEYIARISNSPSPQLVQQVQASMVEQNIPITNPVTPAQQKDDDLPF